MGMEKMQIPYTKRDAMAVRQIKNDGNAGQLN